MKFANRRDANETEIVAALQAHGAVVQRISGAGAPDLLIHFRGLWFPLEVKSKRGKRTTAQDKTRYVIVHSIEDVGIVLKVLAQQSERLEKLRELLKG